MTLPSGTEQNPRLELPRPHSDERGSIQPIVDWDVKSAQVITSAAGTMRANHYHLKDSHQMYVIKGRFDYYWRPAGSTEPPRRIEVGPGDLVATSNMVEHGLVFHEDTMFVNFSDQPRDQETYEADIVRVTVVPPERRPTR